jgi:hypothetical protein
VRQQTERHATAQAQLAQAQLVVRGGRLNAQGGRVVVRATRPPGVPPGPSKFKVHGKVDPKSLSMRPGGAAATAVTSSSSSSSGASASAGDGLRSFAYVPSAGEDGSAAAAAAMEVDGGGGGEETSPSVP